MDSWKYISEGKNLLLAEEMDLTVDGVGRTRNKVMGWEIKPFPQPDSYPFISNTEALESLGVMELGFPDLIRKPYCRHPSGDGLCDELGTDSYENLGSPTRTASNLARGEKGLGRRTSSYFTESNSESPPIDLKLGWLAESKGAKDNEFSKSSKAVSSVVSSLSAKRSRSSSLYSHPPFCQVHGCNKDLSSSKDYHKRHRVCDAHSKTAKVIVNGIEQRFCQQCSRFHLLAEFDDGKRSCRKRLANHNERRRKPQLAIQSGTRFLDSSLFKRTSFLFENALPGSILSPDKNEPGKWIRHIKFEDPTTISNSFVNVNAVGERMVDVSAGSRDNMVGVIAPGIEDVASATNYSCALSLLSNQSRTMSRNMLGTTNGCPLITKSSDADVTSGESLGFSLGSAENFRPNWLYSPEVNALKVDKVGSTTMMCSDGQAVNFKVPASGTLMASDFANPRYCISSGNGTMVDLLQLSSHLERVEQQRSSVQPMLENNVFCAFPHSHGE